MGDTVARIRAAIADHHVRTGYQPRYVVVSAKEDLPAIISGATTVPSKDLNPGNFRINDEPSCYVFRAARTEIVLLSARDLRAAATKWEHDGCLGLALWLAGHMERTTGRRGYSVAQYGELVRRVRAELGDTTDYSEAAQ